MAWRGVVWRGVARCGVMCGVAWCEAWCGVAWCDVRGAVWWGVAWRGVVWCDEVRCGGVVRRGAVCAVRRGGVRHGVGHVVWRGVVWCAGDLGGDSRPAWRRPAAFAAFIAELMKSSEKSSDNEHGGGVDQLQTWASTGSAP